MRSRVIVNSFPTSNELDRFCEDRNICPYETKKMLLKNVDVIVAPYVHILSDDIRDGFLGNMESDGSDIVIIVDEAHNIIDAAREQESYTIDIKLIEAAIDESTTMKGDPPLFDNVTLMPFVKEMKNILRSLANEKITLAKKECLIANDEIENRLGQKFELNRNELEIAIDRMISLGEDRTEALMEKGEKVGIVSVHLYRPHWVRT